MKVEILKKHPHIVSFIASVAVEPTPELKSAIFSEANEKYIASLVLHERDYKKFRHPEDAELVFQMLMMLAKGMSVQLESGVDYDSMMKEFRNILDMLKHNFYKEEYLPVIVLNELTKSYGKHRGIENISFTVEQGEVFGFIGPNGAGKSTTIRTLMGLLKPSNGGASIFGLDCSREPARIAKDVGYLPSENCYYNNMKVKEMLFYTAELYGVNAHSRMEELAERLNLDLSRRIGDLSLGNKKKVGIVSALLPSPKLLIMDEPTSGLDPLIQQAFYDILKEENKRGVTIFLSSHVLSEVQRLCDRVAILREGKLVGVQSMKELRENGYKKISLTAKNAIPEDLFSIPGTANLEWDKSKTSVSFMFSGTVMTIMNQLHRLELEDILIEEPSLEEIFLHYYE